MLKRLLIPLDGTHLAETALEVAAYLALKAHASVTLLHVVERDAPAAVHGETHLTSAEDADRYLERIARECFSSELEVTWHVHRRQISDVAHSLADHADELEPDLIVMATHGRPRFTHWLFGTIPQQVIRRTPTPVLLVHPCSERVVAAPFRQVLVPLDGQPAHEAALPLAAEIAGLCQAPLRLAMVVPTRGTLAGSTAAVGQLLPAATSELLDLAEQSGTRYLAQHVEGLNARGLNAAAAIARGDPTEALPQMIHQYHADLVALGTHASAGTAAFWSGSLGQKLIGRIPTSFLLVPVHEPTVPVG
jgi:nucleotide-binding universal stress UspA family protein